MEGKESRRPHVLHSEDAALLIYIDLTTDLSNQLQNSQSLSPHPKT